MQRTLEFLGQAPAVPMSARQNVWDGYAWLNFIRRGLRTKEDMG